jgi:hypothetical protein
VRGAGVGRNGRHGKSNAAGAWMGGGKNVRLVLNGGDRWKLAHARHPRLIEPG